VEKALKETFRPELLNRIDETIIFEPLTEDDLKQVIELLTDDVRQRLAERDVGLELTDAAKEALVKEGFDPVYGARPLRRTVQRRVENPLSKRILAGEFVEGDTVWWTSRRTAVRLRAEGRGRPASRRNESRSGRWAAWGQSYRLVRLRLRARFRCGLAVYVPPGSPGTAG
jgi:ATP-dependent Clp protease ATP-binding subunit ClpA